MSTTPTRPAHPTHATDGTPVPEWIWETYAAAEADVVRYEREVQPDGAQHYVVHFADPFCVDRIMVTEAQFAGMLGRLAPLVLATLLPEERGAQRLTNEAEQPAKQAA